MALNFQDIAVPFIAGQGRAADDALIQPPGIVSLENGEFDDRSNIKVVDGITNTPLTFMTGETALSDVNPTLRRIMSHKDEVLLEAWNGIYRQQVGGSFALAASSSNRKRRYMAMQRAGVQSLVEAQGTSGEDWSGGRTPNAGILGTDSAVLGEYVCVVWVEQYGTASSNYQVSWQIRHRESDAVVGRGRVRDAAGVVKEPRVVAFGGQFRIWAISGGDLGYLFIDPLQTQNVNETVTKFGPGANYVWLDVALSPTEICISAINTTNAVEHWTGLQATPTVLTPVGIGIVGPGTPHSTMYVDTGGAGVNRAFVSFFACVGSLGTLRWFATNASTGASLGLSSQVITGITINRPVCLKTWGGSASTVPVLLDAGVGSGVANVVILSVIYNPTAVSPGAIASGTLSYTVLSEHLCASTPVIAPGATYTGTQNRGLLLGVYYASVTQSIFQVFDIAQAVTDSIAGAVLGTQTCFSYLRVFDAGAFYATILPPVIGAITWGRVCTPVPVPSESFGMHFWCAKFTPNITNVTQLGQNPTNIQRNTLRWNEDLTSVEFSDLLYMAAGTPLCYDGQDLFEEGFAHAPEVITLTASGGGGPLSGGNYQIVFVYEWFDGQGNRWQSAPSLPFSFVATNGHTYTATVRQLRGSLKSGVQTVPYRTTANGTVFYRDSALGNTPQTDAAIQSSELLYTGPGSVRFLGTQSNNALPGVKSFAVHQNRLFAMGGEFERGFFYSKEAGVPGNIDRFPAEFNRASGFAQTPDVNGRLVAGASVDDKMVFFGEGGLSVMFGQGPNLNWLQNGYSALAPIQSAEGIRYDSPQVALVPDGVWYITGNGPRMLTRGLTAARGDDGLDMGAGVKTTSLGTVGRCTTVLTHPTKPQVLIYHPSSFQLFTYDYQRKQWSFRFLFAQTAAPLIATRGLVRIFGPEAVASNPFSFVDVSSTTANALILQTGWIALSGLQRFQRMTMLEVLGVVGNKGVGDSYTVNLLVLVDYDSSTVVQSSSVTVTPPVSIGAGFQAQFQLHRQQSQAYKFIIIVTPAANEGGNFALASMLVRVGTKRGAGKLPNNQRG